MPTPAVIPRSPFVPRTAQPPYSNVGNSTRGELDRLGLTALRAMVDVEPYGSSDLGGDHSDDEPPSMTSASPSEGDDPEDPENPSGKKKKKKKDRSQVACRFTRTHVRVYIASCVGFMLRCVLEGGMHMHMFLACSQTNPTKPQEPRQRHER